MLYLALSCLQGRPLDRAAADLLALLPGELGLQLTPGCAPGPMPEHIATRTHHGWVPQAMRAHVWSDGALVWRGDSVHPPTAREVGPGWAPPDDVVLETMFPGYALLSCGEDLTRAMQDGRQLAVDIAHLQIQRHHGVLSESVWDRLADYDRIAEVHVSASIDRRDAHAPVSKAEVRSRCPVILNFSTGTISQDVSEQCTYVRESRPEIASLNMGTMNYSKYSRARKSFDFDMVFPNTYEKIGKLLSAMKEAGVKPELECFDAGHTQGIWPLIDMGLLKLPLDFSFIVNVLGGSPALVESLQLQIRTMPPGSEWGVICISHGQWRMLAAALVLGGNVRCGLEDHLYLPDGEMARNNGEIVESAVRLVRNIGRRPATVDEARTILGLGPAV